MIAHALLWLRNRPISFLLVSLIVVVPLMVISCSGVNNTMQSPNTGTINVSLSDPPSCMPPTGHFTHVFITVQSVEVHTSATAGDSSAGWQELAPQLASAPQQIDLFSQANTNCVLAQLGSASLPVGSLQQIRLVLLSNAPAAGAATPSPNACAGHGFNCVVTDDGSIHEIMLSSEAQTGLKIPPGQIMGGAIQVAAGQSVDLNIDFNACFSIVQEGNGIFRLKPALTAGVVSANILVVALAADILHAGARGLGFLEGGWGLGAIIGGLLASQLPQRLRLTLYALSIAGLALGHLAMPFITLLVAAVFFQILFGFFRALSGVVAQAGLMMIVPRHFMGRTQSAMAILTTILQLLMSFALGWISQQLSIFAGFALLALIYALGTLSAFHARNLLREQNS